MLWLGNEPALAWQMSMHNMFRRYKRQLPEAKGRRLSRKRRSLCCERATGSWTSFGRSILVLHFPTSSSFAQACQTLRRGVPWSAIAVMSPHHGLSSKTGFKSWFGGVRHKYVGIGCSGLLRGICTFVRRWIWATISRYSARQCWTRTRAHGKNCSQRTLKRGQSSFWKLCKGTTSARAGSQRQSKGTSANCHTFAA